MRNTHPISLRLAIAFISTGFAGAALAGPQSFDGARSSGMGGTGVASALPGSASFHNPALLAMPQNDSHNGFAMVLPSLSARYANKQKVLDQINSIQDTINAFNAAYNSSNTAAAEQDAQTLANQLTAIDQNTTRADAGAGLGFAVPGSSLGFSFFADATLRASARVYTAPSDINYLEQVASGNVSGVINKGGVTGGYSFQTSGTIIGAAIAETGVSLAHAFNVDGNPLSLGISPKFVQIRTFDYHQSVADFSQSNFHASQYETTDNKVNADIGAAYRFGRSHAWTAGLAVKNVAPMKVRSVTGREFKVDPKVTLGLSNTQGWHTISMEAELTPTKAFGYDDKTQWVSVGAEANVYETLELRAGVRHNIASQATGHDIAENNEFTAGLGFSPFGVNIEASGMVSSTDKGAALELAFNF